MRQVEWCINRDITGNLFIVTGYTPHDINRMKEMPQHEAERKVFDDVGPDVERMVRNGYGYYGQMIFGNDCVYMSIGATND